MAADRLVEFVIDRPRLEQTFCRAEGSFHCPELFVDEHRLQRLRKRRAQGRRHGRDVPGRTGRRFPAQGQRRTLRRREVRRPESASHSRLASCRHCDCGGKAVHLSLSNFASCSSCSSCANCLATMRLRLSFSSMPLRRSNSRPLRERMIPSGGLGLVAGDCSTSICADRSPTHPNPRLLSLLCKASAMFFSALSSRASTISKRLHQSRCSHVGREPQQPRRDRDRRRDAASFFVLRNSARARRRGWITSASAGAEVSIGGEMRPGRIVLTWESDDDGKLIEHEPGAS